MKIRFSHENGIYDIDKDICLTEAFAEIENETYEQMFLQGWLPNYDGWYQSRSCRLLLQPISTRRRRELTNIDVNTRPDVNFFINKAGSQKRCLEYFLSQPHFVFGMDDALLGVVNYFDEQIFYSTMIYDKNCTSNSCGTLSYYYLIEKYRNSHKYLYTSTYYDAFEYKSKLPGFEFWNGEKWITL